MSARVQQASWRGGADTTASMTRVQGLIDAGLPVVLVNGHRDDVSATSLSSDDGLAVRLAVEHLLSLGHERIGLAIGPTRYTPSMHKLAEFRAMAQARGFEPLVEHTWFTVEGGELAGRGLLARGASAVICGSDLMALGVIRAAQIEGRSVPGDVSVVGYDGSMMTQHTAPPLTTLRQNVPALANGVVDELIEHLRGHRPKPRALVFTPELVVRASTGPGRSGGSPAS